MWAIGQIFWLFLPLIATGILHLFIVNAGLFQNLAVPMDGGMSIRGAPLFGANKTWRGVVVMVLGGTACGALQGLIGGRWAASRGIAPVEFEQWGRQAGFAGPIALTAGYAIVNAIFGLGYIAGELPNSFIKRRLRIPPGDKAPPGLRVFFFLFDRLDSMLLLALLSAWLLSIHWPLVLLIPPVMGVVHLLVTGTLRFLRIKKTL